MLRLLVLGALVGFLNGLLGGGGGAILVPGLLYLGKLSPEKALASSLAIMFPLSILSVGLYFLQGNLHFKEALPYVLGGAVGGILGGKLFPKIKTTWLKKGFYLLLLLRGARCFL